MGKAAKWFRGLLGLKKPESATSSSLAPATQTTRSGSKLPKKKWSFVRSFREATESQSLKPSERGSHVTAVEPAMTSGGDALPEDPGKHAIVVAAAAAAVAEAAVAAAQAAAAVVRLTSSGRSITTTANGILNPSAYVSSVRFGIREESAAVKIQSLFRAYLARRAFRALKALVKLQALVRGRIVRKQTADMLRRMQAMLRAQARARAGRTHLSDSPYSSLKSAQLCHGPATPEKFEHVLRAKTTRYDLSILKRSGSKSNGRIIMDQDRTFMSQNWLDSRINERSWERGSLLRAGCPADDERSDKILEMDSGRPQFTAKRGGLFQHSRSDQNSHSFTTSKEPTAHQSAAQSFSPLKFHQDVEDSSFCTANNSPQHNSASSKGGSSRRGPFTPTKSSGSRSCLSLYSDHPNYMAYTESSKAKIRSLSAPKQRPQFERSSSTKRHSVHWYGDTQDVPSAFHAAFTGKAYPGSGRLDRLGLPLQVDAPAGFIRQ